jgi:hypothetical protein
MVVIFSTPKGDKKMQTRGYIIFRKSNNKILAIEHSKKAKDCYNSEIFDYVWWDCEDSGAYPQLDTVFSETRTYDVIRKAGYELETDPLLPRVLGREADGDTGAWAEWEAARETLVKARVPKTE